MLQVSAVVPATPHVSTHFWGTSAELAAAFITVTGPATAGPVTLCQTTVGNSARNQRGSLKKVLLRPTVSASLNPFQPCTKKWGDHDHR
jgi:hypothetical protein